MISLDDSNRIIELRSKGLSFDNIATITKISKPTVMKVCHERLDDISRLQEEIKTEANESVTQRQSLYTSVIEKATSELLSRDMSQMTNRELIAVMSGAERSLSLITPQESKPDTSFDDLSDEELMYIANGYEMAKS